MAIKKGDAVRQVIKPIEGVVIEKRFDDSDDSFKLLVEYANEDGSAASTWFDESQVEAV